VPVTPFYKVLVPHAVPVLCKMGSPAKTRKQEISDSANSVKTRLH
jgi:hypothetical protein